MPAPPAKTEISDTYPNPSNAVARTGFGKLWETLFGTGGLLGGTGNPSDARNSLGIGSVFSFRNLLINGNFAINQRAYVSGTNTGGANQYTLDRWRIVTSGQNATFGAAAPDRTVTFPAGGGEQVIEGAMIVGGVYTLSWIGAATAKVNGVAITNGGNTSSLAANTNVTIQFIGAVGLAQFELGTVATPFERRHLQTEFDLCQRYYETGVGILDGYQLAANAAAVRIPFKVTKRAVPTLGYSGTSLVNLTTGDARNPSVDSLTWFAVPTASAAFVWEGSWTAAAEL